MNVFLKAFFITFLLGLVFTPIMIKIAPKLGYLDIPKDNRRMHKKPIPLLGGLSIYLSTMIGIFLFCRPFTKSIVALVVGSSIIVLSGLIDDRKDLSPKAKIVFQLLAGITLLLGGVKIDFLTNPLGNDLIIMKVLSIPITLFWITGITNTVNLIDGLDGLASGVSGVSAISLLFIAMKFNIIPVAILSAILAGACFGFLPYNFNPAKIFMGDTGALFLGFVLAYISIEGVMKSATILMIFVPVITLGIPVFDTAFAMVRRKLSGRSMVSADKGHLHHRLLGLGLSQKQTVGILYLISIIFGVLANVVADFNSSISLIVSILIILAIILIGSLSGMFKGGKSK